MGALIWLIAGIALIGLELAVGELTFLMLGLAALATAGVAMFHVSLSIELIIFALMSLGLLLFLKPLLRRHLTVGAHAGQVRLDGSIWSARSLDPAHNFSVGERVSVVTIDGTTAVVWKETK